MEPKNQGHKKNHVLIFTSDEANAEVKQIKIRAWAVQLIVALVCVAVGFVIGYIIYEEAHKNNMWSIATDSVVTMQKANEKLTNENKQLENQIVDLKNQVEILSGAVNQKVQSEGEMKEQMEVAKIPTILPINGSASVEASAGEDPKCSFKLGEGTLIVNSAEGVVTEVTTGEDGIISVTVDHRNGYVTIYKNNNACMVHQGDYIYQGTTLFVISEKNSTFTYQISKDGAFIDPMSMLQISG